MLLSSSAIDVVVATTPRSPAQLDEYLMSAHESITAAIILKDKSQDKRSISQKLQDHDVSLHFLLSRENQ